MIWPTSWAKTSAISLSFLFPFLPFVIPEAKLEKCKQVQYTYLLIGKKSTKKGLFKVDLEFSFSIPGLF